MIEKHFGPITDVLQLKEITGGDVMLWRHDTETNPVSGAENGTMFEDKFVFNINKPSSFKYAHAKEEAFIKWDELGIPCPGHFCFLSEEDFLNKLENSAIKYPLIIRVNNMCDGLGSWLVNSEDQARVAIEKCAQIKNTSEVGSTKMMCVEFIDTTRENENSKSFRIIVAGEKMITGYGRLSGPGDWVATTKYFTPSMEEEFVEWNKKCEQFCLGSEELIVKAVRGLGLNHQGVDVILDKDDNPYFIEVQPLYSTGYEDWLKPFYNPYYPDLVKFLLQESKHLKNEIPLYYENWLNKERLFDLAYSALRADYENNIR